MNPTSTFFPKPENSYSHLKSCLHLAASSIEATLSALTKVTGEEGADGVVVVHRGREIWAGPRADEVRPIWSCTKSFMSTCLGLLWDDGKCHPEDSVGKYLPHLAHDYPKVTLRHLATFTSGLHANEDGITAGPPDYTPGTAIHYSGQSNVLGHALTRIAGEPLKALIKRRIADPIGMDPSCWDWNNFGMRDGIVVNGGAGHPDTGLWMSARNLARFGWLYANDGVWDRRRLISHRYIDYATKPHVAAKTPLHDPKAWYSVLPGIYGLNWWTNGIGVQGKRLWPSAPARAFAAQGNLNNICIIVPEWKLVLVRTGQDKVIDVDLYDTTLQLLGEGLVSP